MVKKYLIWALMVIVIILFMNKIFPFPGKYKIISIPGKENTKTIMIDTINGNAWELEKNYGTGSEWKEIKN